MDRLGDFLGQNAFLLVLGTLFCAILAHFRPGDRRTVANTYWFFMASLIGQFAGSFATGMIGHAIYEAFIVATGMSTIRICGLFLFRAIFPLFRFSPPRITEDILVILAYAAWVLVRLRYAGLDLSGIVATSAVMTAVIAFSMQDTLGNILGGIALQLDNSIEVGDWIKLDDVVGRVSDIRWRFTAIETRNWETVVVPNSQLMKSKFSVLGRRTDQPVQLRRWVWFNVDLSAAPSKVISLVNDALNEASIPDAAKNPPPNCVLMDFENGYGRYAARYWLTDLVKDDPTDSEVRSHVLTALQRAGLRIAIAEHSIHTIKEDEKHQQMLWQRELARRLESLKKVDLFASFTEDELHTIAERLIIAPFSKGDMMTRQGAVAHWLYILISGEADIIFITSTGEERHISTLKSGSFFGEMALMTGEPRRANVIAKTDVQCYRLDKSAFESIVQSRPEVAEEMSHVLASRKIELESVLNGSEKDTKTNHHLEILGKIRQFFSLS